MKLRCPAENRCGWTLLEVVVVIFLLALLFAMLMPGTSSSAYSVRRIACLNNLKQTGMAFNLWAGDHQGQYPMNASVTNGGVMEAAAGGDATAVFQVMSNELGTPRLLVCPADKLHRAATDFAALAVKNISYCVGLDARTNTPRRVLSGDDNFELDRVRVRPGWLKIPPQSTLAWSLARHQWRGNLLLADGSVLTVNNAALTNWFGPASSAANPLIIP